METEAALKHSGIPFTILRNGWYTENYGGTIPGAIAGGALLGSAGDGKISAASRKDYADAAVTVLTTDGHQGRVYELAGDEARTKSDTFTRHTTQHTEANPAKEPALFPRFR